MDNIVLDIAIGLIFIFVLYSLLASTISEFVATIFSYRQRMLDVSLEQMLDGRKISYYWWDKLLNILIWLWYRVFPPEEKTDGLADQQKGKKDVPNFQSFVLQKNIPEPAAGLADASEQKSNEQDTKEENKYKRIALDKKAALFASEITNHPLYLRSAENSWLNKKPAYLPSSVFSDILLDILKPDPDEFTLLKDIKKRIEDHPKLKNNDTKKILKIYLEQANGDLLRFKLLVEDWYNETQKRVSGWYKRQNYRVLLIIGFCLAITFNVSTIEIVNKLSNNPALSKAWADQATEYVKANTGDDGKMKRDSDSALYDSSKKALKIIDSLYKTDIQNANTLLGLGWGDVIYNEEVKKKSLSRNNDSVLIMKALEPFIKNKGAFIKVYLFSKKVKIDSLAFANKPGAIRDSLKAYLNKKYEVKIAEISWYRKVWYVAGNITIRDIIGFLITAFAISLGAPFWFDLLNKFVNLRVSGKKPEEGGGSTAETSKTAGLNKHPAPQTKSFG